MGFIPDPLRELFARRRLWVGVAFWGIGLAIFGTTEDPIRELGLALAIAMVVAVATDALIGEAILDKVDVAVERITEALAGLKIVEQAEAAGVSGIYVRRDPSKEAASKAIGEMFREIEGCLAAGHGLLRLMGVAVPSLLAGDGQASFRRWLENPTVRVEAILVDPDCEWARIRQALEKDHTTLLDIGTAIKFLNPAAWKGRVHYCLTDVPLPAFVVITNACAFVEPYPIAPVVGALGGRTPLLKLKCGSSGYNIWNKTFDTLWICHQMGELRRYAEAAPRDQQSA